MFKIKIEDQTYFKNNPTPYVIRYELIPEIKGDILHPIIHQSLFSNKKTAFKVASNLSNFLDESLFFLELIYTKLKQLEVVLNNEKRYLNIDFNAIEKTRFNLLKNSNKSLFAYQHITYVINYISALKRWCFAISKDYYSTANKSFQMLLSFELHFINSYRSAEILANSHNLKLFL